jgi:phosphonoacetaldehyde hydrolase
MLQPLVEKAAAQGYRPDATVTPDEVGVGRPAPFMILENLVRLQVWPPAAVVKVGDTPVDIEEGRNAGVWTVAVAATGNELALSRHEFEVLSAADRELRVRDARERLRAAGAHWVVDTLDELPGVIDAIEALPETALP